MSFWPAVEVPFPAVKAIRVEARRAALVAARDWGAAHTQDLGIDDLRDSDLTEHGGFLANRGGVVAGTWEYNLLPDAVTGPDQAIAVYGIALLTPHPVWAELELTDATAVTVAAGFNLRTIYGPEYNLYASAASAPGARASWIGYFDPVVFPPSTRVIVNVRALVHVLAGLGAFTLLGYVADTDHNRRARFASRSRGDV